MHVLSKTKQRSFLLVALLLMGCLQLLAQTRTIKGEVTDAQNGDASYWRYHYGRRRKEWYGY